jgi:hypothetical protein
MVLFQQQQELLFNNLLSYESAVLKPDPLQYVGKRKRNNILNRYENNLMIKENIMKLMQENKALWL